MLSASARWLKDSGSLTVVAPRRLYEAAQWYACRTRSRAEKRVHRVLARRGIECYLPLIEHRRQWSDRTKRVSFPLFPGYLFARFDLRTLGEVLVAPGVVEVVRANGYPTPIREEEIASIRILAGGLTAGELAPEPVAFLHVGEEVIVTAGPFGGMRGTLVAQRGRSRVAVRLSALRQAVSVEISHDLLRSAGSE